jgi:hypothetical protein
LGAPHLIILEAPPQYWEHPHATSSILEAPPQYWEHPYWKHLINTGSTHIESTSSILEAPTILGAPIAPHQYWKHPHIGSTSSILEAPILEAPHQYWKHPHNIGSTLQVLIMYKKYIKGYNTSYVCMHAYS